VGAVEALGMGLADQVIGAGRPAFEHLVMDHAAALAASDHYDARLTAKHAALEADARRLPLDAHRVRELAEMRADIFDDRHGFSSARLAFVSKQPRADRRPPTTHAPPPVALVDRRAG
jgi:putative two-component system hydrogenase maturation factor HypX/HoxX